jgi:hypothetical protein
MDEKMITDGNIEVGYYRTKVIGDSHQFVEVKKGFSTIRVAKFDALFDKPEITIIADTITIRSGPIFGLEYFKDKVFDYTVKLDVSNYKLK